MEAPIARAIAPFAGGLLDTFPCVVVQGARQVGKSTLAHQLAQPRDSLSLTLDDDTTREAAVIDPVGFVNQRPESLMVIDELQRAPQLVLPIKAAIDRDRRPGRFLLTGSSNLLRLAGAGDSLAGRAVTVEVRGFSQGEAEGSVDDLVAKLRAGLDIARFRTEVTRDDYASRIARGGYPEALALTDRFRATWFSSYVERMLGRDVRDIAPRVEPSRLEAVLRLVAANQAGELVKARIAQDANVAAGTADSYLDLLETLYLTSTLRPWTPNLTSRETARAKVIVNDSGLALRLARVSERQLLPLESSFMGSALEGFIAAELLKQRTWSAEEFELFHYRDRAGIEVDLVAELSDGSVMAFEVKSSSTVKAEHFKGLKFLRDKLGARFIGGYVLNTAQQGAVMGDRLAALPAAALWEA